MSEFEESLLDWFADYYMTAHKKLTSDIINISAAVQQESILDYSSTIIFIRSSIICHFVDDNSLYLLVDDTAAKSSADLQTICEWADRWIDTFNSNIT